MSQTAEQGTLGKILAWVPKVSGVLALAFALVQATRLISERMERGSTLREQLAVTQQQLDAGDHAAAWASAGAAAAVDARADEVRRLQEDVAMAWLRAARVGSGGAPRTFTQLVTPLVATLDRGALETTGARQADLLAHRGWADFLRGRDGPPGDPAAHYARALAADAANPYAHAMWGHWALWNGERAAALDHFAAAAASGRERSWVRGLQLAALANDGSLEADAELLRVANAMRLAGDTLDAGQRRRYHTSYVRRLGDPAERAVLLAALPPHEHLATYRWLFAADLRDTTREATYHLHHAMLLAQAGDTAGALAEFRRLQGLPVAWRVGERAVIEAALGEGAVRR